MATLTKRGKSWFAQVRRGGHSVSRSFTRKMEAQTWATQVENEIVAGTYGRPKLDSLAAVCARYAEEVSPSKGGVRWERIRLASFQRETLAERPIANITPENLGHWRDQRLAQVSPGTVLREMTLLTAVFEHARREWRLIAVNPWRDVRKPKAPRHRERRISDDEIERITLALGYDGSPIATLSQQVAVMFLLAIETAMRAGELLSLRWSDVDLQRRVAHLRKTKNGDQRSVPLSEAAVSLIAQMPRASDTVFAVEPGSRDALFRKAVKRAGCVDLHFHDTRAEACTRLSKKLDVLQLARMIGHRDPKSLMVYYRETAENIAKLL